MNWTAVWEEIKAWFVKEGKDLEAEIGPFVKQFASDTGQAVLVAAEKAVAVFVTQEIAGTAKQAGAYDQILKDLEDQGLKASTSLINSAIEAVYAKLKASEPTS